LKPKAPTPTSPDTPTAPTTRLPERGGLSAPAGATLAAALRGALPAASWNELRRLCQSGKVTVEGAVTLDPAYRLRGGEPISWRLAAPDPRRASRSAVVIVHEDPHLLVIDKPEGISSVPYERKQAGTAMDLVREVWRKQGRRATATPLYTVHRLDKDTSGLLCFAKTRLGERGLHKIFKQHLASRSYLAVAQGAVTGGRLSSYLVPDRGDGLRGSPRKGPRNQGQLAVTHVTVDERLPAASLCRVRLETGRTHQIRIHLAETGHPLVGETVYIRDLLRAGGTPLPSPRLLLHATTLGFDHPVTGARLEFESALPADYLAVLDELRRGRQGR
jgi:23S rRNA pseudouridine1911/1915/1917 synthase